MRKLLLTPVLAALLASTSSLLAQTGNGQVSGIVKDSSGALLPGVTVTLKNIATGVDTTQISNATGAYSFASVPPGAYNLTAQLANFKQSVVNELKVGTNAQVRWDFKLQVGDVDQRIEVTSPVDTALTESSASVGVVLNQQRVADLPLVGQNILDLLRVLPGFRPGLFANTSTVGGLGLDVMNATINGVSTNSARDSAGLWGPQVLTTNVINPDMVSEIRLILAPVDAELGRGNAQVQIQTRSGTNKLGGSFVWNVQNSATDANTWDRNRLGQQPDWYNLNQLTGSIGGPIVKNKTFFYFLYDRQLVNRRELVTSQVLTDTARQGIFRYWSGWNPGDALTPVPQSFVTGGATPTGTWASVDFQGHPVAPLKNPDGSAPYSGGLVCFSLFGNVKIDGTEFGPQDCPGGTAVIRGTPWDTFRPAPDSTGYIRRIIDLMPEANVFARSGGLTPDGLNTGLYQWVAHRKGPSGSSLFGNAIIGVVQNPGDYNNRQQSNIKIDHTFNARHRLSVNWTYEQDDGDGSLPAWGGPLKGLVRRRPQFLAVSGTSALGPSMVNEARFGVNYSRERGSPAWANPKDAESTALARTFLLQGGTNPANGLAYPILFNPGPATAFGATPANTYSGFMNFFSFDFANTTPLWDYADTLRWSSGKHSFSVGMEYRRPTTTGYTGSAYPTSGIGPGPAATAPLISANTVNFAPDLPGFLQTARNNTASLLYFQSGSIVAGTCPPFFNIVTCTSYWIDGYGDVAGGQWQDVTTAKDTISTADPFGHQNRTQISNEWSFFAKDDFKIAPRLTLNLGARYDFAGSPYLTNGLTNTLAGDGEGLFGAGRPLSGDIFDGWLTPGNLYLTGYGSSPTPLSCQMNVQQSLLLPVSNCDPRLASTIEFVGPGTPNPEKTLVPQHGRISPAIGFAWRVPWFGDRTTVRGGFQRTYGRAGATFTGGLLSGPGGDTSASGVDAAKLAAILATRALNLTDLPQLIPAAPPRSPGVAIPMTGRSVNISYSMYDKNYKTPYTDNLTLSMQRTLTRNLSVELRYVNTVGRAQPGTLGGGFGISAPGSVDINTVNVYHNSELFNALENTRAGLDDPLFDQMLMGLNLNPGLLGYGPVGSVVGGVLQRGSAHIRRSTAAAFLGPTVSSALANGNYAGVIQALLPITTGFNLQPLPVDPATGAPVVTSQRVLRNGCDRIANGQTDGFTLPDGTAILPRCFPENYWITNPQLSTADYAANYGRTNYNAFEAQFTLRPTYGITVQGAYGFSKTMELPGSGYTDPLNRQMDYRKSIQSVGQDFRANGIIELPIGPNKFFMGKSSGLVARLIERWQTGFIVEMAQGAPRSFLTNNNMLYANGRPDVVGPWNNPQGTVAWNGQTGSFFGDPNPFATYADPQCAEKVGGADRNGFNLRSQCTLLGLALVVPEGTPGAIPVSQGRFGIPVLQNPLPGHQGTLGANTMNTHGRWRLDANMSKAFHLSEDRAIQVRIDALNVLNHPEPGDPAGMTGLGSSFVDNFGQITTKSGQRSFQGKLRFIF